MASLKQLNSFGQLSEVLVFRPIEAYLARFTLAEISSLVPGLTPWSQTK
jgi:hypothetical protein